jgi:HSP20 family molecular chaperone IbpA
MSKELQTQKQEVQVSDGAERTRSSRFYVPHVDIYANDEEIFILADMPGVDEKNVDITLEKNVLTINGFVDYAAPEGYEVAHTEYGVGDFQRSFTLPDEIDRENIGANMKNGVLHVNLPKAPELQTRRITVQAG